MDIPGEGGSIRIKDKIGSDYTTLGTCLLNDNDGNRLREIEKDHHHSKEKLDEIFYRWKKGEGRIDGKNLITWGRLIECLNTAELLALSDDIESVLCMKETEPQEIIGGVHKDNRKRTDTIHIVTQPQNSVNYHKSSKWDNKYSSNVQDIPLEGT